MCPCSAIRQHFRETVWANVIRIIRFWAHYTIIRSPHHGTGNYEFSYINPRLWVWDLASHEGSRTLPKPSTQLLIGSIQVAGLSCVVHTFCRVDIGKPSCDNCSPFVVTQLHHDTRGAEVSEDVDQAQLQPVKTFTAIPIEVKPPFRRACGI